MQPIMTVNWSGYSEVFYGEKDPYDLLKVRLYRKNHNPTHKNPYAWMLFTYLHQHNLQRKKLSNYIDVSTWDLSCYLSVSDLDECQRNSLFLFNVCMLDIRQKKREINDMQYLAWLFILCSALYMLPAKQNELYTMVKMFDLYAFSPHDNSRARYNKICILLLLDLGMVDDLEDDESFFVALSVGHEKYNLLRTNSVLYLELREYLESKGLI